MDSDLSKLIDDLAKLTKVEALYLEHSEDFWEVRKDTLQHIHESCNKVARRVHIRLADTGVCMFHFRDFTLADTSAQRQ